MKQLLARLRPLTSDNPAGPFAFLGFCFVFGAFVGGLTTAHMTGTPLAQLSQTFTQLYTTLQQGALEPVSWWIALRNALLPPTILYLFSFSVLGLLAAPSVMAVKGFMLSVTVTSFVKVLGISGLWLAIACVGVQLLLILPLLLMLSTYTFTHALQRAAVMANRQNTVPPQRFKAPQLLVLLALLCITAVYEVYAVPPLMGWLASGI